MPPTVPGFCQIQYNYVDTDIQAGDRGYALTEKLGIPLVIMEPVKGGSLAQLPEDVTVPFTKARPNSSISSWALRWVASKSNVKVVLSGMSTMEQVEDNLHTFESFEPLTEEETTIVSHVADNIKKRTKNGCTGCAYCMPCPFGSIFPKTSVSGMIFPCMVTKKKQDRHFSRIWIHPPEAISARNVENARLCVPSLFQSGMIWNTL